MKIRLYWYGKLVKMLGDIHIINPESVMKALKDVGCGNTPLPFISNADFEIRQTETFSLPGYEMPEGFPNCCEYHKGIVQIGKDNFKKFPFCCDLHQKLLNASWFDKRNYAYVPYKLVKTISYTTHCISAKINSIGWFKEITDYIEYSLQSFGQLPLGYGSPLGAGTYLQQVEAVIMQKAEISVEKKDKLVSFINILRSPSLKDIQTDVNLLISSYQEWIKIFPFELSFLQHLKPYFDNQIPILAGEKETNLYSNQTKSKLKTNTELVQFLIDVTQKIVEECSLFRKSQPSISRDAKELQLELLYARRKVEVNELSTSVNLDRKQYIKILKKWLAGEKRFVREISALYPEKTAVEFIETLMGGVKLLQQNDTNEYCVKNIHANGPDRESAFRYWFKDFITARCVGAVVTAEEEKGNGRIDLKVYTEQIGDIIIEFKGWWNQDKKNVAQQVASYLTDFENKCYVIMINHLPKDITDEYKLLIEGDGSYIKDSWKTKKFKNTSAIYFESIHKFTTSEKTIAHIIYNVFTSTWSVKKSEEKAQRSRKIKSEKDGYNRQ